MRSRRPTKRQQELSALHQSIAFLIERLEHLRLAVERNSEDIAWLAAFVPDFVRHTAPLDDPVASDHPQD